MIPVLMYQHGYTLQEAVDCVGELCRQCIERFEFQRRQLPTWGPKVDADVQKYVLGLQHWIVGSLHWSFDSERYFGTIGLDIKKTRVVNLLPKRPLDVEGKPILEENLDENHPQEIHMVVAEKPMWRQDEKGHFELRNAHDDGPQEIHVTVVEIPRHHDEKAHFDSKHIQSVTSLSRPGRAGFLEKIERTLLGQWVHSIHRVPAWFVAPRLKIFLLI